MKVTTKQEMVVKLMGVTIELNPFEAAVLLSMCGKVAERGPVRDVVNELYTRLEEHGVASRPEMFAGQLDAKIILQ